MKHVLIVEDSLTVRMDLNRAFRSAGWAPSLCRTAADAREAMVQERFDAVVLGVFLPDATGVELAQALKGSPATAGIPVVLLADRPDWTEPGARPVEVDEFAGAPYDAARVVAMANRLSDVRPPSADGRVTQGRILAVDDSPTYLLALCAQLQRDGFEVLQAASGQQALDQLNANAVDCILLDMLLPDIAGPEVCRRVKDSPDWRLIPVVMLTGREDREAVLECFDAGADDYVPKSGDFVVLRARLRAQLRRRQVEAETGRIREDLLRKQMEVTEARAAREATQRWNDTLEQRIAERTAEVREQADQLRALASELTQAEQRERKRLATILHDHIQQLLVATQIQVGILRVADPQTHATILQGIESTITEAISAARSLAVDLSPPILHTAGLAAGLSWLANHMATKSLFKVHVHTEPDAEPRDEDVRLLLFESVRELLLNALKHAGVQEARVSLTTDEQGWTRILVEDAGRGFDPSLVRARGAHGFGLFSIQQRLAHLGGRVDIGSAPGNGTRIVLSAPPGLRVNTRSGNPDLPPLDGHPDDAPAVPQDRRISVLLVDDHEIMRQGLVGLLSFESDLVVAGEASSGREAVDMARRLRPDVVIMDVNLPDMTGIEATRIIVGELPRTRVIGLSMHEDSGIADDMHGAGAVNYLTKGSLSGELVVAIRTACSDPPPG